MNSLEHVDPFYRHTVEALAQDLARLDHDRACAVLAEVREMVRAAWLRQELDKGRASGEPLDGQGVFADLLAEADADIETAKS